MTLATEQASVRTEADRLRHAERISELIFERAVLLGIIYSAALASALAGIVDAHIAHPLGAGRYWGPDDISSSGGQFFRAGGRGEARADHNALQRACCSTHSSPGGSPRSTTT